jgi:ATP-dependent Clp protease ATP-binding subunit ClpC
MFERFTDRARQAIVRTQEEARALGHANVDVEHLLVGLIRDDGGLAYKVLTEAGVELDAVRSKIVEKHGDPDGPSPAGHLPFTPEMKKILEYALREALRLGHNYIGTEHLLLALLQMPGTVAVEILADEVCGVDVKEWRTRVLRLLAGGEARRTFEPQSLVDPSRDFEAAQSLVDVHLFDRLAAFAKRTGATISISYPREQ